MLTVNVSLERKLPLLLSDIQNTPRHHLIRMVVEQDVNGTHLAHCLLDHFLAVLLLLEICGVEVTLLAVLLNRLLRLLRVLLFFRQIGDEAVCALHGE